jgi:hypothetical protein
MNEFKVSAKPFKIQDLVKAIKEKRVYEAFGVGTAALISPTKSIHYEGETY